MKRNWNPYAAVRPPASQNPTVSESNQIFICGEPYSLPTIKIELSSDSEDNSEFSSEDGFPALPESRNTPSPEIPPEHSELPKSPEITATTSKPTEKSASSSTSSSSDSSDSDDSDDSSPPTVEIPKDKKCPHCERVFTKNYSLKFHLASHVTENNFKCIQCPKAFADGIRLNQHVRRVHTKQEPQVCKICGKSFKSAEYLRLHSNRHTDVKKFGCELCGKRYTQGQHLKMHIMRVHEGKSVTEVRRKGRKPFICPECGKTLWDVCNYKNHIALHTNEKAFKCPLCPKTFKLENYVKTHMKTHSDEKPFVCDVCSAAFKRKRDLKVHKAKHMEKTIPCKLCDKSFKCRPLYRLHMVGIHRGIPLDITDGPLPCTLCKVICKNLKVLKKHVKVHENEKPFECAICGEKFYDKLRIRRHIRQFHSQFAKKKSKKLYPCPDCPKVCKGQQSFLLHRASHGGGEPVECKICSRTFTHKFYLGRHMTYHRGDSSKSKAEQKKAKDEKCPYCTKKFKKKGFLKKHIEKNHEDVDMKDVKPKIEEERVEQEVKPTETVPSHFVKVECLDITDELNLEMD